MRVCLLILLTLFSAALGAQYSATVSSAGYVPRFGSGVNAAWRFVDEPDDNCRIVNLPAPFRFFDRTYNTVFFSTNGRLSFTADNATTFNSNPITAPAPVQMRE